ncbi:hypothetical protein [Anaerotignum lactatifermentans]
MAFVNGFFLIFPKKIKNPAKCREIGANVGISGIQHTKNPAAKVPFYARFGCIGGGDFVLQTAPKENRKTTGNILFSVVLVCRKTKFYTFFKNAEGLGERRGQHICFANASHKWLSASLAVWGSPNGIPRGKAEVSRLLADGTSALYFCLLVKGLNEMSL